MKTLKHLLLIASLSFAVLSLRSAETTLNFEDGVGLGGQSIGAHYAAMGVTFGNAAWVSEGTFNVGNTPGQWRNGAAGLGAATGCYHDSNYGWQSPCSAHPITATFSPRVTSVSITSFNPGINGVRLTAFDSVGNVVGTDQFIGEGAGTGTKTLQVTSSSTPIDHIALDQPNFVDSNDDGVTFDDLSFTVRDHCQPGDQFSNVLLPEVTIAVRQGILLQFAPLGLNFEVQAPSEADAVCEARSNDGTLTMSALFPGIGWKIVGYSTTHATLTLFEDGTLRWSSPGFEVVSAVADVTFGHCNVKELTESINVYDFGLDPSVTPFETIVRTAEPIFHYRLSAEVKKNNCIEKLIKAWEKYFKKQ